MKKIKRICLLNIIILFLWFVSLSITATAEPIIENITLEPSNPEPLSTITFTATITSEEDLDEIHSFCLHSECWTKPNGSCIR